MAREFTLSPRVDGGVRINVVGQLRPFADLTPLETQLLKQLLSTQPGNSTTAEHLLFTDTETIRQVAAGVHPNAELVDPDDAKELQAMADARDAIMALPRDQRAWGDYAKKWGPISRRIRLTVHQTVLDPV